MSDAWMKAFAEAGMLCYADELQLVHSFPGKLPCHVELQVPRLNTWTWRWVDCRQDAECNVGDLPPDMQSDIKRRADEQVPSLWCSRCRFGVRVVSSCILL